MKAVLVYFSFGISLTLADVIEIGKGRSGSDSSGIYNENSFGSSNGFQYGNRKTEEQFHTVVGPLGNIISRATGEALERGEGLYPEISDNGKVIYIKSNYNNYGTYDSSTATYGYNENSAVNGNFDGSGQIDVRAGGLEQPKGVDSNSGLTGFRSDAISISGNPGNTYRVDTGYKGLNGLDNRFGGFVSSYGGADKYRGVEGALSGFGSKDYYDRLRSAGKFAGFGFNSIFNGIGSLLGGFGGFGGLGNGGSNFGIKPPGLNLPRPPVIPGLINQKFQQVHEGSDNIEKFNSESGSEIGSNECGTGPCGGQSGSYAFASASARAGSYSK